MWKLANITKMGTGADQQQYPIEIIREFWKLACIVKCANQCRYPMEIIGKILKLTNISKMGLRTDKQQSPMKIIRQMWKFANIVKMGLSADQCQYSMKIKEKMGKLGISAGRCRYSDKTHIKQVVETGSYRRNGSKYDSRSISHQNHKTDVEPRQYR